MKKKAEAISVIFLVVVGLVALFVFFQQEQVSLDFDIAQSSQVVSEVELNIDKAISVAMEQFLRQGFSSYENGDVWYCNSQFPVNFSTEGKPSLKYYLDTNIKSTISVLEERGFTIDYPTITIHANTSDIEELKNSPVIIELSDFYVYSEGSNVVLKEDLAKVYQKDWPVWDFFFSFYEWNSQDAGSLEYTLKSELFESKSCQALTSKCDCEEDGFFTDQVLEELNLKSSDVKVALDMVVSDLEEKFESQSVSCSYEIDKIKIDNQVETVFAKTKSSVLNGGIISFLERNTQKYDYDYGEYVIDYAFPDTNAINNGCPSPVPLEGAIDRVAGEGGVQYVLPEVDFNSNQIININAIRNAQNEDGKKYYSSVSYECTDEEGENSIQSQKTQLISVSKKLALLFTVRCEDSAYLFQDNTPLASEVSLRIAIGETCPVPYEEVELEDQSIFQCVEGEGPPPIPEEGVCESNADCSICETCGVFNEEFGIKTCQPKPYGTTTGVTCEICDGQGNTTPLEAGFDDCSQECHVCNGINVTEAACQPASVDNGLYDPQKPMTCDSTGHCNVCGEDGTCSGVATEEFYLENIIDSQHCGACNTCGINSDGNAACVANIEDNNEPIPGQECRVCMNGSIEMAPVGYKDSAFCSRCETCTNSGACGFVEGASRDWCPSCMSCGASGDGAACVSDSSKDGRSCGQWGCMTCSGGVCGADLSKDGNACRGSSYGCTFACENGRCNADTVGDFCSRIFPPPEGMECLESVQGICSDSGSCVPQQYVLPEGQKCCGTEICSSNEECCNLGNSWICGACNDETT